MGMTDEFETSYVANIGAEMSVLGSILVDPAQAAPVFDVIRPDMFGRPAHQDLASLLASMMAAADPIDPQSVLSRMQAAGMADRLGSAPYLHTLMERAWMPANAPRHAEDVLDAFRRRRVIDMCTTGRQMAGTLEAPWSEAVSMLAASLDEVLAEVGTRATEPPQTVADLLATEDSYDWLIPGLIERSDRLVLTGEEGLGKSWMLRQFAACMAAGLHPFTLARCEPLRVLVVDCENSQPQNRRAFRPMAAAVAPRRPDVDWTRLRIAQRPEGLDLIGADDMGWLERTVQSCSPDVLIIGPLYRLHSENINDEQAARKLVATLDMIRVRHRLALIVEAHSGHGSADRKRAMRPVGSSLFLRWPEFGFGLRRAEHGLTDVVSWRGSREDRRWPIHLARGGQMPWSPSVCDRDGCPCRKLNLRVERGIA